MNLYDIALVFHLLGVVFGLGGATVSDVLFLKSLKDEKITPEEKKVLGVSSFVIWLGIAILIASGAFMFFKNWDVLSGQARMQAHVSIAFIVIVNGLLFNIHTVPKIALWSEEKEKREGAVREYRRIRKIAFLQGAVSLTSWYSAFLLGISRRFVLPPVSYIEVMVIYAAVLLVALLVSLFFENFSWKKRISIPL